MGMEVERDEGHFDFPFWEKAKEENLVMEWEKKTACDEQTNGYEVVSGDIGESAIEHCNVIAT